MASMAMNDGSSSAVLGPEVRVVSLFLPLLVTLGLHTAAIAAVATERAVVPERPVEPVELLEAPRTRDAAAGLRVVGAAAAACDAAVRGVDEDGPHDAVHGTGDLEAAAKPGTAEDSIITIFITKSRNKPLVRCRIIESSNKRGLTKIIMVTNK